MVGGAALPVLVAAAGEQWEAAALEQIEQSRSTVALQRRCVDVHDLLASARTGMARAALVSARLPGLDADTADGLRSAGLGLVVVLPEGADEEVRVRMLRLGAEGCVAADLDGLVGALEAAGADGQPHQEMPRAAASAGDAGGASARVLVVWGPAGAPGRTTVATGLAAELAARGRPTFLMDADPYGGAVAQHLGVLDEVSGLLAAARSANAGRLDAGALAGMARGVGTHLRVLTGLPRPDRWAEVRPAAFADVLDIAGLLADHLVVDVGFSLEGDDGDPFAAAPRRNTMTLAALERADDVLVVGGADPVGLARLARALVELAERFPAPRTHVVVNRSRPSLGWSEGEVRGMVEGFHRRAEVGFLPDDAPTADRALMAGRSVVELGDSPLRRGIAELADALVVWGDRLSVTCAPIGHRECQWPFWPGGCSRTDNLSPPTPTGA